MVVPIHTVHTTPAYIRYMIDGYTFKPDVVEWVPNLPEKRLYENLFDEKVIEAYEKHRPSKYLICHASDLYLMPEDLINMVDSLESDKKAFCSGLYPTTDMVHTRLYQKPDKTTRITVWRADIFGQCLEEYKKNNNHYNFDALHHVAQIANKMGFHPLVSTTARPQRLHPDEFQTMRIK